MKTSLRYCLIFILALGFKSTFAQIPPSNDATLKSIVLSTATNLVYTTGSSDYNYTTSVSPGTTSLTVTPTVNTTGATVTVNGTPVTSGRASGAIVLNGIVTTTINLSVTAADGVTIKTYSITVYETGSNNAYLDDLTISTGNTLVKSNTGSGDYNYTVSVDPTITSVKFTPTTADPTATVTVNGVSVTSGQASGSIPLSSSGSTTVNTTVTAQDGVTQLVYSVVISNTGSNNATLSSITLSTNTNLVSTTGPADYNYTTAVNSSVTSLKVTPTSADGTAQIKVNGTVVATGTASGAITLNAVGSTTTINITVLAQDGVTQKTYAITVSRNGSSVVGLSNIALSANSTLVSTSGSSNINYTTSVSASVGSLTITPTANDPNSTTTINGVVVASGVASGPITLNAVGTPTVINIINKSQDGTKTQTTSITVNRNGSNNATLSNIVLSTNTSLIQTSISATVVNYKTSISPSITTIAVKPFATDSINAKITVNGVPVTTGTYSGPIQVSNATPQITIVVTAEDGTVQTSYITVLTNGSNNANLTSIAFNATCTLVPTTGSYTTNYTTSVSPSVSTVTITPTAADPNATIKFTVNGTTTTYASGTAIGPITLAAVGSTTNVLFTVTSPDGSVTKTTGITIARNGSNNANLSSLSLSTNTTLTSTTGTSNVNYTSIVSPHTISLTVLGVLVDPNAKFTVNGLAAQNNTPSSSITLNNGSTPIVVQVTAEDGVTKKSYSITVTKTGKLLVWTGATNTTWSNSGNWNPTGVPGASDVASIGEVNYGSNQPILTASANVGEVYFGSAKTNPSLTITSGTKLTVGTGLTVNAGANASLNSSSSSSSSIDIAAAAVLNVNSSGANIGKLTIASAVKLTLKSAAAGSASLGQLASSSSITGTVSVERFLTGGSSIYRGYRLLTSSVNTGSNSIYSLNYITNSCYTTGTTGTSGGFDKTGNPTLYLYRENLAPVNSSFTGGNYRGINNLTAAPSYTMDTDGGPFNIPIANGFLFFFRGDRAQGTLAAETTAGYVPTSTVLTETGTLNQGQYIVKDWYTPSSSNLGYTTTPGNNNVRGFNLVGNPYASSIDWDTFNSTTKNSGIYGDTLHMSTSIYILDPVSKNYGVYMANSAFGGTNNATHVIPSGQGFFVMAFDASAQLIFNEDAKVTTQVSGPNLLLGKLLEQAVTPYLHLKLKKDTVQADEIFISFKNTARPQYNMIEDAAQKQGTGIASLASMSSDGVPLSINTLRLPKQSEVIALNVKASTSGQYQITIPEIKSLPKLYDVWLMDAYKKDSLDVKHNPKYVFDVTKADTSTYGSSRFSLVIRQNPAYAYHLLDFSGSKIAKVVQLAWVTENEGNYTYFTVQRSIDGGKTFDIIGSREASGVGTYSLIDSSPFAGVNQYRLMQEDINGNITYSKVVVIDYSSNAVTASTINIYPNPAISNVNVSVLQYKNTPDFEVRIVNNTGKVVKAAVASQTSWQTDVSTLLPGAYVLQVVNSKDKTVVGKGTFIKL